MCYIWDGNQMKINTASAVMLLSLIHILSGESDEESTVFEVKKTDAGYRISNIDYHPDLLGRELLRDRLGVK